VRKKSVQTTLNVSDENNKLPILTMFVTANIQTTFHAHIVGFIIIRRYIVQDVVKLTGNKSIAIYMCLQTKLPYTLPIRLLEYIMKGELRR
jgi:hypothetical protein